MSEHAKNSRIGSLLERYKQWYLRQSKLVRIVVIPLLIGLYVLYFKFSEKLTGFSDYIGFIFVASLLIIGAYNQLIDADEEEEKSEIIESLDGEIDFLNSKLLREQKLVESLLTLNEMFSETVLEKSKTWTSSIEVKSRQSREEAIAYVKKYNSKKENIDRLVQSMYRYFDAFANKSLDQSYRVVYFTPTEDGSRLSVYSWGNRKHEKPRGTIVNTEAFGVEGRSLASYIWAQSDKRFELIDDVESYVSQHGDKGIFCYISNSEKSTIQSIACFRVEDGATNACLGVLSIDTNVPGGLGELFQPDDPQSHFTKVQQSAICERVLRSFACRIVFEDRFDRMKTALNGDS